MLLPSHFWGATMLLPSHFWGGNQAMQATMQLAGKRPGRPLVVAAAGHNKGLLFLTDSISKRPFLVDTEAEVSVLPTKGLDTCKENLDHHCLQLTAVISGLMEHVKSQFTMLPTHTTGISW